MWGRTLTLDGLEFSLTGGGVDCFLMLSPEQVVSAGDRITEILDWFLINQKEYAIVEFWRECTYDRQHFDRDDLETISRSRFATEEERRAVFAPPVRERFVKPARKKIPGYVYIIRSGTGHYKIGKSKNAEERITSLGVVLPFAIEPICVIRSDDMGKTEKELHGRFADKRVNGEWFRLEESDLEYIRGL